MQEKGKEQRLLCWCQRNMYKVVVVEDEKLVRQGIILETNWNEADCVVVGEAGNGEEGYEVICKYNPDFVSTDIKMPRMTGLEMIERVEQKELHPFVIFLTAYDDFAYAQQAIKVQAADYLLKPFEDGQLEDTIKKILTRNQKKSEEVQNNQMPELQLKKGEKSKYIMDAMEYIDSHYASTDISVKNVAESLGISEGHLGHLFRKETDFTLMTYVTNCRIRAAMNLLKDYKHKVYEIAELVGYRDITYFSNTFKKYVGVSPSEYQDRYRN